MKVHFKRGLVPAVVQDYATQKVLKLGFMNEEALKMTEETGVVTLYNRDQKTLWKQEESGGILKLRQILVDCEKEALLVKVDPSGPVCITGADTCWSEKNHKDDFLYSMDHLIQLRIRSSDIHSYVRQLGDQGPASIMQKIREITNELDSETGGVNRELFLDRAAGLFFHYIVLLQARDCSLSDVTKVLEQKHQSN